MNKFKCFLLIGCILTGNLFAGNTGMSFLDMPTSAQTAAAMGVFSSEPTNGMMLFENPIGIYNEQTNINFTNNFWFADVNQSVLTLGKNTKFGTFGAGLNFVNAPDIEVRSAPSDEPEGEINAQFLVGVLGFTREIIPKLFLGINGKYLYQSLYTESASGFALDAAAMWKMPSNLHLTFAMKNIGKMAELKDESTTLPAALEVGIVRPNLLADNHSLNGALGIYFDHRLTAEQTDIKVGGELSLYEKLFLRGGYSIQKEYNNASFGIGFQARGFRLDVAMLLLDEIPDYPYILSFSYDLK